MIRLPQKRVRAVPAAPSRSTAKEEGPLVVTSNHVVDDRRDIVFRGPGGKHLLSLPCPGSGVVSIRAEADVDVSGNGATVWGLPVFDLRRGEIVHFVWSEEDRQWFGTWEDACPKPAPFLPPPPLRLVTPPKERGASEVHAVTRKKVNPS